MQIKRWLITRRGSQLNRCSATSNPAAITSKSATLASLVSRLYLLVVIAIAYSITTIRGERIRKQRVQRYVGRTTEPKRFSNRHSYFWLGLYGKLWIDSLNLWSTLANKLMALKPQNRRFFQRGLSAISLIQSVL